MSKFKDKVKFVMKEYGKGKLHLGNTGKYVKDRKQALAIAYSMARKENKK